MRPSATSTIAVAVARKLASHADHRSANPRLRSSSPRRVKSGPTSACRACATSVGSAVSSVNVASVRRMVSCRRPASSGSSSVVPATSTLRSAVRAWSRSMPSEPRAFAAALVGSLSVANSKWCDPTAASPANRCASSRLVVAATVVRTSSGAAVGALKSRCREAQNRRRFFSAAGGTSARTWARSAGRSTCCCTSNFVPRPSPSRMMPSSRCSVPM